MSRDRCGPDTLSLPRTEASNVRRFPSTMTAQLRASSAVMLWRAVVRSIARIEKLTGHQQHAALLTMLDEVKRYGAAKGEGA